MTLKVYIETTIPSYLTARPSRDLRMASHQQVTHAWWDNKRINFKLFISQFVEQECADGDALFAEKRLNLLRGIPQIQLVPQMYSLAKRLIVPGPLPLKAETDALHISVAAVSGMDFLLTWNCKHIANAAMQRTIGKICRDVGFEPPVICTPEELLGE